MQILAIKLIKLYQKVFSPFNNSCRFIPSCSNYGIEAIERFGFWKGGWLLLQRLLRCNPWGASGLDPVIKEDNK